MAGYEGDAHELVNYIAMPHSRQRGVSLLEATQWALQQQSADQVWSKIPPETINMLSKPETYTGAAAVKAREIARSAETYLRASYSRRLRSGSGPIYFSSADVEVAGPSPVISSTASSSLAPS